MARRPALHDVELDDDDDGGSPPPPDAPGAPAARRRRLPLVLGAAVLAVLVAVGVTGQVVLERRERTRFAAVAAHPGAVTLLDGPPAALWTLQDHDLYAVAQVRAPDGLLVGVRRAEDGSVGVTATDPATGDVVWRVEVVAAGSAARGDDARSPVPGWCEVLGSQEHLVVCLADDGTQPADGAPAGRVVVVDTRDRALVTELSLPAGERATWATPVGDLVVVTSESSSGTTVRALTADGTSRWSTTVPPTSDPEDVAPHVLGLDELVALVTSTELRLLDQDGRAVRTLPLDGRYVFGGVHELHVVSRSPAEGSAATSTIVRPEGDIEVPGEPVSLTMDDGSVPGLVLTIHDGELTAWLDGEERWSVDDRDSWSALLLDGRVYLDAGTDLQALDARTGRELWVSDAVATLPVTDGRHLLAAARTAGRGQQAQMVALDPADGSEMWRAPVPAGTLELLTHRGLLLATDIGVNGATLTVLG